MIGQPHPIALFWISTLPINFLLGEDDSQFYTVNIRVNSHSTYCLS